MACEVECYEQDEVSEDASSKGATRLRKCLFLSTINEPKFCF